MPSISNLFANEQAKQTADKWKVFECVANNAPNYFIVSTRAFRGTVAGKYLDRREAEKRASDLNARN